MARRSIAVAWVVVAASAALYQPAPIGAQAGAAEPDPVPAPFAVEETTIADIHEAMRGGTLTCRALVQASLNRIAAFDKKGPAINAIVVINPAALDRAAELDARFAKGGLTGPLHCIPAIVKDNFETIGLQSANGSLSLEGFVSAKDAFLVKRIKDAGAIVIAKSNMAEWAFTPYETVSSILPGYTKNPYALDRVTAGSSGGTAAAIAASFGVIGLGSDTGNSIRGPASHQALVGIRSTMGLTSRAGVMPLNLLADIAGPIMRTVADAAAVFQVLVGEDPDDPVTSAARGRKPEDYTAALDPAGLRGARIGILRQAYESKTTDPEIVAVFNRAIEDMKRAGAEIVDPAPVEGLDAIRRPQGVGPCMGFRYDINRYLAAQGDRVPVKSLADVIKSRRFHPTVQRRLEQAEAGPANGPETPECQAEMQYRGSVREVVLKAMDGRKIDAYVYPTWSNPPRLIGDLNTPHGDNSQFFSPTTGFPAIQVPMGYTRGGKLPAGVTFLGRPWSEAGLLKFAYAYEQQTSHRHAPSSTPRLATEAEMAAKGGGVSYKAVELSKMRRQAHSMVELPTGPPPGWSKSPIDPALMVEAFPSLRLKAGYALRGYLFAEGGNGNGFVYAMRADAPFPEPDAAPTVATHFLRPPKPADAAASVMTAIDGDGTPWSYVEASILGRELEEFGARWHGVQWGTHSILDASPLKSSGKVRAGSENDPKAWKWARVQPKTWAPSVKVTKSAVTVTFYTMSALGQQTIFKHVDTYAPGSYVYKTQETAIAVGPMGFVF